MSEKFLAHRLQYPIARSHYLPSPRENHCFLERDCGWHPQQPQLYRHPQFSRMSSDQWWYHHQVDHSYFLPQSREIRWNRHRACDGLHARMQGRLKVLCLMKFFCQSDCHHPTDLFHCHRQPKEIDPQEEIRYGCHPQKHGLNGVPLP